MKYIIAYNLVQKTPHTYTNLAAALIRLGATSEHQLRCVWSLNTDYTLDRLVAYFFRYLDEDDRAFIALTEAIEFHPPNNPHRQRSPVSTPTDLDPSDFLESLQESLQSARDALDASLEAWKTPSAQVQDLLEAWTQGRPIGPNEIGELLGLLLQAKESHQGVVEQASKQLEQVLPESSSSDYTSAHAPR